MFGIVKNWFSFEIDIHLFCFFWSFECHGIIAESDMHVNCLYLLAVNDDKMRHVHSSLLGFFFLKFSTTFVFVFLSSDTTLLFLWHLEVSLDDPRFRTPLPPHTSKGRRRHSDLHLEAGRSEATIYRKTHIQL